MPRGIPERPIRTLEDLPETGLIFWTDFLSNANDRRLVPFTESTWRRMVRMGEAPPAYKWFGRLCAHAEQVRAVSTGIDWRAVSVGEDAA